jgi:glycosyltransferase involved in cell wall biosynthesis
VEKVNILYFLNSRIIGGVERHVVDLIRRTDRGKYNVFLVVPSVLSAMLREELSQLEVEVMEIEVRSWLHIHEIIKLMRIIRRKKIGIAHSHDYYASRFFSPVAKLAGVPLVIQTAHMEELWRTGWRKYLVYLDYMSSLFADKIIAVSHAVKKYYVENKKINHDKIVVIHNGADFESLEQSNLNDDSELFRDRFNIKKGNKIVLVVGRLVPQKGHTYLIEAAPRIIAEFPECRFVFAGEGELKDSLMEQTKKLGLGKRFIFTGYVNNIYAAYKTATVVVLPSLYEGLPYVAIEASYMSCPVVATAVSGTPDIVLNEVTGLTVSPKSPDSLAEAVLRLFRNHEYAKKLANNAREYVLNNFSIHKQIAETEKIYDTYPNNRLDRT